METLAEFIERRMVEEGMRPADVARAGDIPPAQLSRFLSGDRGFGEKFLWGIARAFNEPLEKIYRLAGWLPPVPGDAKLLQEIREVLNHLEDHHLSEILDYANMRYRKQLAEQEAAEREKKRLREAIENASPEERANLLAYAAEEVRLAQGDDVGRGVRVPRILGDQPSDWLSSLID